MSLLQELLALHEGEVIHAKFGPEKIPTKYSGYAEFEFDPIGDGQAKLIGVGSDDTRRTELDIGPDQEIRKRVAAFNKQRKDEWTASKSGSTSKIGTYSSDKMTPGAKPISMMQAFGSASENALADAGIKLTEKPDEWSDFDGQGYATKRNIHEVALKRVEKVLGKLKTWTGKEVFGYDHKPKGPQVSTKMDPKDLGEISIVKFSDGSRYLVSPMGANTYIRNWQKIV